MSEYLVEAANPKATAVLMKAMKLYHASGTSPQLHHLDFISQTNSFASSLSPSPYCMRSAMPEDSRSEMMAADSGSWRPPGAPPRCRHWQSLVGFDGAGPSSCSAASSFAAACGE